MDGISRQAPKAKDGDEPPAKDLMFAFSERVGVFIKMTCY
jgi:hypothetical protein